MTQLHDTTESIKGKHLTNAEWTQIEILKRENYSNRDIAARLGRAPRPSITKSNVAPSSRFAVRNRIEKYMIMSIMSMIQATLKRIMKPTDFTPTDGRNGANPMHLST